MQINHLPAGDVLRVGEIEVSLVTAVHKAAFRSHALHARSN